MTAVWRLIEPRVQAEETTTQPRARSLLIAATLLIWITSFVAWTVAAIAHKWPDQLEIALRGATCDLLGVFLCGGVYLVLRRMRHQALTARMAMALALSAISSAIYTAYVYVVYYMVIPIALPSPHWVMTHIDAFIAVMWTFLAWCGVYFTLELGSQLRDTEALALDAQNRMLRYQLDPEFLFSIHASLEALIHDGRNAEAERLVLTLSRFLRRSLEKHPAALAPLGEEIEAMRDYIGVERARIGERLHFIETIQPQVADAMAPSFILQPLLESSIRHGLRDDGRPITIELGAAREGADLKLWVRDDAHDEAVQRDLQFVRSRLEAIYGDEAHVATEATAPGGLRTVLTLPLGYA